VLAPAKFASLVPNHGHLSLRIADCSCKTTTTDTAGMTRASCRATSGFLYRAATNGRPRDSVGKCQALQRVLPAPMKLRRSLHTVLLICWAVAVILLMAALPTRARAQTIDTPSTVRRLPPLTSGATRSSPASPVLSNSALPRLASGASPIEAPHLARQARDNCIADCQYVQRTSAVGAMPAAPGSGLRVRRLPPLADARIVPVRRANRPASPAHIGEQAAGSRSADSDSRVIAGTHSIAHRAVYLGVPPLRATDSDLSDLGRATLRPAGLLPRDVPSPDGGPFAR
jgi:hypothetical protein